MSDRPERALIAAVRALYERKAINLVVLDIRGQSSFADFFVICHGTSERQVRSLGEGVEAAVRDDTGLKARSEGYGSADWVLLDYGDMLVHVFSEDARELFRLERLWTEAPRLPPEQIAGGEIPPEPEVEAKGHDAGEGAADAERADEGERTDEERD